MEAAPHLIDGYSPPKKIGFKIFSFILYFQSNHSLFLLIAEQVNTHQIAFSNRPSVFSFCVNVPFTKNLQPVAPRSKTVLGFNISEEEKVRIFRGWDSVGEEKEREKSLSCV